MAVVHLITNGIRRHCPSSATLPVRPNVDYGQLENVSIMLVFYNKITTMQRVRNTKIHEKYSRYCLAMTYAILLKVFLFNVALSYGYKYITECFIMMIIY